MATYFLEFSDQNYGEICYSIRKVPMGQSKFTAQSFQKSATFDKFWDFLFLQLQLGLLGEDYTAVRGH
jgi:hypothetical protein